MKDRFYKCLQLGLVRLSGCLSVFLITTQTLAQQSNIIPDNTLGAESSRLNSNIDINGINADSIDGGALRSRNLFHSFREFNINDGQAVYFVNPAGIQNILTRVTGGNPSNIFGTLGVDGAANLFLINPNGIVFGDNASLDLQGSFLGTTASGIQFGEQGNFSATNPEIPGSLTINPSALFFNQVEASGGIINKSQAPAGINPDGIETTGLRVPDGKSLLLVGGDINFDGGRLRAYEGNIELASVTSPGTVGLDISGNTFNLNVPEDVERGDISLVNESYISVFGAGGGNFTINARNLEISNSIIYAGIGENSENPDAQAGDVNLNATGFIKLTDSAGIDNSVYSQGNAGNIFLEASNSISVAQGSIIANNIEAGGIGTGGNINIKAGSISVTDGSEIQALLRNTDVENNLPGGEGNTGNIFLEASNSISLVDGVIANNIKAGGIGKGGNINIKAASLSITDGSEIQAILGNADVENNLPGGQGNTGNISLEASNSISLVDRSFIFNSIEAGGIGKGGNIKITTKSLSVGNRAGILAYSSGQGDAGNITINVTDTATFDDLGNACTVLRDGVGNGGTIRITAGKLLLTTGSYISTANFSQGNSGDVFLDVRDTISFDGVADNGLPSSVDTFALNGNAGKIEVKTGSLFVTNSAEMNTIGFGQENSNNIANGGDIIINARDTIKLDGVFTGLKSNLLSGTGEGGDIQITTGSLFVTNGAIISTDTSGRGDAGNININAGSLSVTNGGLLFAFTSGRGDAGNININARDTVTFDGIGTNNFYSHAVSAVLSDAVGNGGDITINTKKLSVTNGAQLNSFTNGEGDAGKIKINAGDKVIFDGVGSNTPSGAFSTVESNGVGNAGDIELTTGSLSVSNGAILSVASLGKEDAAGNIEVQAQTLQLDNGFINAETASTKGGDITLQISELLLLRNGSEISTTAGTAEAGGDGGNIDINSKFIVAIPKEDSDISANAFTGRGGNVNITSRGIFGIESRSQPTDRSDITASSERGISGETNINSADTSSIQNSFTEISPNIDTDAIIAGSCIARGNKRQENSFTITGSGALRSDRPGNVFVSKYTTGEVRAVEATSQPWKKGDPIIEPQGLYRLSSGELLLSRECSG